MTIHSDFSFGQRVFLRCRVERNTGMVTAVHARPVDCITYSIPWADGAETAHFAFELATEFIPDYSSN
jgi:hypothetical protein